MHNPTNHLILSSTSVEGTNVRNLADEKLGDIKDIMLDIDSGRIVYAVLAVSEGFLGLDSKYFAIPWQALRFDTDREIALLDISKERLKDSPGFDKDNWPATPQREFVDEVHTFYGYDPFYNKGEGREAGAFERSSSDANVNRGTTTTGQSSFDRNVNDPDLNRNTGDAFSTGANDPNRGTTTGSTSYDRDVNDPNLNRDRGDDERRTM